MNGDWHKRHTMPQRATLDRRPAWHLDHSFAFSRSFPFSLFPFSGSAAAFSPDERDA
jgi:hypothetical protein